MEIFSTLNNEREFSIMLLKRCELDRYRSWSLLPFRAVMALIRDKHPKLTQFAYQ